MGEGEGVGDTVTAIEKKVWPSAKPSCTNSKSKINHINKGRGNQKRGTENIYTYMNEPRWTSARKGTTTLGSSCQLRQAGGEQCSGQRRGEVGEGEVGAGNPL